MTCVWEPDETVLAANKWSELTEDVQERALLLASSTLQMLTYYRVGTCPITIRPIPSTSRCGCGFNPHQGVNGRWYNNCHHRAVFGPLSEIDIPGPVGYIDSLLIDGVEIDIHNGDWRLDNGHLLVWQGDGPSPVPSYQDLNKPDTDPGTWSLTYSQSYAVLADGRIAVAFLALQFAEAIKPKGKCALPRGVTSVVRHGVSFSLESGLFTNGLTGIDTVDQYILKWAPAGSPTQSATVFDPRSMPPRITNAVPKRRVPTSPLGSV